MRSVRLCSSVIPGRQPVSSRSFEKSRGSKADAGRPVPEPRRVRSTPVSSPVRAASSARLVAFPSRG